MESEGGGEYVTKYGTASISRPNTIAVDHEDWNLNPEETGDSIGAEPVDPPPTEIPPSLLPKLARTAVRLNLEMAMEYKHSIKRRAICLVVYNICTYYKFSSPILSGSYIFLSNGGSDSGDMVYTFH